MKKSEVLLKAVSVYLIYFIYMQYGSLLGSLVPFIPIHVVLLFLDILFLILILCLYHKNLEKDWIKFKKDSTMGQKLKIVLFGFLSIILANFVLSLIGEIFHSGNIVDQNTTSIQNMPLYYAVFKTMIFGVIAEEILFRESLGDVIENKWVYILGSSVIYTAMNFVFTISDISIMQILGYFIPALVFGTIYIKNERNIIFVMIVKFAYHLIPLTILLLGV